MASRYVTLRVFVDGKLSSKLRAKRVIRRDEQGEFVHFHGKRRINWIGKTPVVDVSRKSMAYRNRADSQEATVVCKLTKLFATNVATTHSGCP